MVRSVWVGVAFVCGAVLGVLATRAVSDRPAVAAETAGTNAVAASVGTPSNAPSTSDPEDGVMPHLPAGMPVPARAVAPMKASDTGDAAEVSPTTLARTPDNPPAEEPADRHIEVGAAFHQQVDRPSVPGFPNEFGDAHRTLEREARDNSWSDSLEAEIRNSLTADVSSGNIKVDFLECRSTVCELRLSSTSQSDALNAWSANSGAFPWSHRLQTIGMSMASSEGGTQGLWIFRKPPK